MPARKNSQDKLIDAAMALAAEGDWHHVTLIDIATRAGLTLSDVHGTFRNKADILRRFVTRVDQALLDGLDAKDFEEPRRDRLLDIMMTRFDLLAPHRTALRNILHAGGDLGPMDGARAAKSMFASMRWMLEAAGFETGGVHGSLRVAGMSAIYARCFRQWLSDETPDLGPTMAALDRGLDSARIWDSRVDRGLTRLAGVRRKLCTGFGKKSQKADHASPDQTSNRPGNPGGATPETTA
jgi:AcrR family transcriptional regulator